MGLVSYPSTLLTLSEKVKYGGNDTKCCKGYLRSSKIIDFITNGKRMCDFLLVNKSAQSKLGKGPRSCALAHIRRKVPIGYNGASQVSRQKYPFPWTDPQTPLPALSLDSSDIWCQTASGSDRPFCHNALDRPTDRPTDARTYGPTDRQIVHGKVWRL